MRIAVFGDISSDYEGLKRFFRQARDVAEYICLGDIGHHKSPNGKTQTNNCIDILRDHDVTAIKGNHDELFVSQSANSLTEQNLEYLTNLPERIIREEMLFCHKSPKGKFLLYKRKGDFEHMKTHFENQRIVFFGHSHKRLHLQQQKENYNPEFNKSYDVNTGIHFINPGTIDGAKCPFGFRESPSYVLLNKQTIEFRKIHP